MNLKIIKNSSLFIIIHDQRLIGIQNINCFLHTARVDKTLTVFSACLLPTGSLLGKLKVLRVPERISYMHENFNGIKGMFFEISYCLEVKTFYI